MYLPIFLSNPNSHLDLDNYQVMCQVYEELFQKVNFDYD